MQCPKCLSRMDYHIDHVGYVPFVGKTKKSKNQTLSHKPLKHGAL